MSILDLFFSSSSIEGSLKFILLEKAVSSFDFISSFSNEKLCCGCDEVTLRIFSSGSFNKALEELIFYF